MDRGRPRAPAHLEALRRAFIENAARRGPAPPPFSLVAAVPAATSSRAAAAGDESKNKVR